MDKWGIHRFLELYDQGKFDAFEFSDEWSFGEVDEPTPDWIRDRIPPRRLDDDLQAEPIPYPDYDIDEIFDYENNPNLPSVADLDEDRALTEDELDLLVDQYSDMVGEQGFEALAWYVPFHYATRDWGIYIREEGIKVLRHDPPKGRGCGRAEESGSDTYQSRRFPTVLSSFHDTDCYR